MKKITKEEKARILELSKIQWISCKEYMPEEILEWIEDEDYHTPRKWWKESEWDDENNCPVYHYDNHQDLHYLTPKVLVRSSNGFCIDFRRKFDSRKHFIWNKLEGAFLDYNFYWKSLGDISLIQQLEMETNDKWADSLSYTELLEENKKFNKTIEIEEND